MTHISFTMTQKIHNVNGMTIIEYEKSNIYIIENILDTVFCDELIKLIDILPLQKLVHCKENNVECNIAYINKLSKLNDELYYPFETDTNRYNKILDNIKLKKSIYTNQLNGITHDDINKYIDKINCNMLKIENIMEKINKNIKFNCNSGYLLRKNYGKTILHIDNMSEVYDCNLNFIKDNKKNSYKMIRNASIIFGLNDNYDGGMFNFPYYDITFKLKKGSVVIFPPYWTHEHEVCTVENNTYRYTLSTWSCMKI